MKTTQKTIATNAYINVTTGNCCITGRPGNEICAACYSSILGGFGNSIPSGYNYAGIFGCNITAVRSCSFHANNFVAQNMPLAAGAPGSGIFYIHNLGGGICVVGIS